MRHTNSGVQDYMLDLMEHRPNGRFLSYDPDTGSTEVLLDGLYFANGVAVSPGQSFVLVAETGRYRVLRYWLAGPKKGEFEVFVDNLPGFPNRISTGTEFFWLAFVTPRDSAVDFAFSHPPFRKVLVRLPSRVLTPPRYGFVLGLDLDGRVIFNLQDPSGSYAHITSVQEEVGMLYLGSFSEDSIGRLPVPQ